jgi:hypothetical protein
MELYPIIAPFVNYTYNKVHGITSFSKKVATDLTLFSKNKARRMLAGEEDAAAKTKEDAAKTTKGKEGADGADGAIVVEEEKLTTSYPNPLFENDEDV